MGAFVRAHRERLDPTSFGLDISSWRRTAGLRREEVAQLAGLSVTWITWIEQGRDISVSAGSLAKLAGALRMTTAEQEYLFELAGRHKSEKSSARPEFETMPLLAACVRQIACPAYVLDRFWHPICWNELAEQLLPAWLSQQSPESLLHFFFLNPAAKQIALDWKDRAKRVAYEFRAANANIYDDADFMHWISELRKESVEFDLIWSEHKVLNREGGQRSFVEPAGTMQHYNQVVANLAGTARLTLTILVPVSVSPGVATSSGQNKKF
ncbi:MAG: putative DNA-binding protein [Planctomycetaceae bacterium]|nr:putative DNA-binding protein [Planctomycetaceae bacterium]